MHEIRSNTVKNRLYLTIQGKYELAEFKKFTSGTLQEAKKLKPKFGVVSDISGFTPGTEEVRLHMQDTMKALKEMGMGQVVRVVRPEAAVVANQWQRTSRTAGYTAEQAETHEEADKKLDLLEKAG